MNAAAPFAEYVRSRREIVERELAGRLVAPPACPPIISEAMRYSLLGGGKRFRPLLALAAAEAIAARPPLQDAADAAHSEEAALCLALPAACALEMIHTYSLIHDDLPAMDNDDLRRGRPTLHVVHGEGMAILAGDGLLTEAFGLLAARAESDSPAVQARRLRTLGEIAAAAGAAGMVGGQAIDLLAAGSAGPSPGSAPPMTIEALRDMHARKTGALVRAAGVSGAIMAGGSAAAIEAVRAYAVDLGLAFQIVDDILDVEGSTAELGKTAGKDAAAAKPTYPAFFGLDASRTLARDALDRALGSLARVGLDGGRLEQIARWVTERNS